MRHAERMGSPSPAFRRAALAALVGRVHAIAATSADRVVIGITGSPGAGKTTLAAALVAALDARDAASAVHVPMDGFHLANSTLDRLGLRDRKGAIETFDGWGFVGLLERIRHEVDHTVYAPGFDRRIDEPVAGEIAIEASARVVVIEGNYLLADASPWRRVRGLLDEAWFCATDEAMRVGRLVARHTEFGRTPDAARSWALEVDGANALGIEASRERADLVVSGETGEVLGETPVMPRPARR